MEVRMLDFVGTIAVTTVMVVCINAVVSSLPVPRAMRIMAALAVGLWIGLAAASATAGVFADTQPFPYIGLFVLFPLAAIGTLALLSPTWRAALLGLPAPLLIGLNTSRVIGVFFLLLAAAGRLGGPFPFSAGWGDIIVGVLAAPALWLAVRQGSQSLLTAWNVFGVLDLVIAVALGVTSAQNSPLQVFDMGAGSTAFQALPWALVPTVLVPFYLIAHAVLFAQWRRAARLNSQDNFAASAA
jgi:hypothetical protein